MVQQELQQLKGLAQYFEHSGYFDKVSLSQAVIRILAGRELGFGPFASVSNIHIIKGKPTYAASLVATLIANSQRYDYRVISSDSQKCEIEFFDKERTNGVAGVASFTIEEAKQAELLSNTNWKKYPSDMLFARAITRGARRYCAGIFGGNPVYTPEEMGAQTDEEGFIVALPKEVAEIPPSIAPINEDDWKNLCHQMGEISYKYKEMGGKAEYFDAIFKKENVQDWPEMKTDRLLHWKRMILARIKKIEDERALAEVHPALNPESNALTEAFNGKTITIDSAAV